MSAAIVKGVYKTGLLPTYEDITGREDTKKTHFLSFFLSPHNNCLLTYSICAVLFSWQSVLQCFAAHMSPGVPTFSSLVCFFVNCGYAFVKFAMFSVNAILICISGLRHLKQSLLDAEVIEGRSPQEVGITGNRFVKFQPNTAALKDETKHENLIWGFKTVCLTQHEMEDWLFFW